MPENQYKPWEVEGITEATYAWRIVLRERQTMHKLRTVWHEYGAYLRTLNQPQVGETWPFTCPFHQRIDDILREED